jgi:hypothetical protein
MIYRWLSLLFIFKSGLLISGQSASSSGASSSGAGGTSSSGAGGASSGYGTSSNGVTQYPLIFGKISASTTPLDFTELGEVRTDI